MLVTARRTQQGFLCERSALLQCSTGQPALSGRGKTHTILLACYSSAHTDTGARSPSPSAAAAHACMFVRRAAAHWENLESSPPRAAKRIRTGRLAQCPASVGRRGGPSPKAPWARIVTHACRQHGHGHAYPGLLYIFR